MKDEKTGDDLVSIGFVVDLDYRDATTSAHDLLQPFKLHPLVKDILEGGERVAWGAKALPGGGYWSMPKLSMPGALLVGDAGGMVDTAALKGVHHCIKSGILAAEAIYKTLKSGRTARVLRGGGRGVLDRQGALPGAQHPPAVPEGLPRREPARRPVDHDEGQGAARPPGVAPRRRRADVRRRHQGALSQARRQVHLRQALERLHHRQRDARRRPQPHPVHRHVPREIAETWRGCARPGVYEIPDDAPEPGRST